MKKHDIPTGFLIVDEYSKGQLETLSIGDYGKSQNIKAQFLGFNRDINGVANGKCLPLSEKWVMTLSTQYGCAMKCKFCDCHKVPFKGNVTYEDLQAQFLAARNCFPDVKYTDRLNIHYARMGEPLFNFTDIYEFTCDLIGRKLRLQQETDLRIETIHPVLTTMLPRKLGKSAIQNCLSTWCYMKNKVYNGQAGLQLSINSTSNAQRNDMFNHETLTLEEMSEICRKLPEPIGRKYCLNFALADDYETDGERLAELFDSEKFTVKITPIHNTDACKDNDIKTNLGYESYVPYKEAEESFIKAGFDVIVFVPSKDEEDSLVTCGNAILSGSEIK